MERARVRRRRLALGTLAGLATGAFALGAALGEGRPSHVARQHLAAAPVGR